MQIVLLTEALSGEVGFAPEIIEGFDAPRRSYDIVGGILTLTGQPDVVLHHDAEELLQQSIYRLPTPLEQEQMTQAQEQATMAQESVSEGSEQEDNAPDEPPAQSKSKKNGGG